MVKGTSDLLNKDLTLAVPRFARSGRLSSMRAGLARGVGVWHGSHWNLRTLLLATLVVVALALGILQYRWIDEVSQAQETRAKARLAVEVRLISDAFDSEISAALFFTIPRGPAPLLYDMLQQTWETWNHDAPWPRIVSGVSLLESKDGGWQRRSLGDPGAFDLRLIPPVEAFADSPAPRPPGRSTVHVEARSLDLFARGEPYLLLPLPAFSEPPGPPRINWLLIRYDPSYLAGGMFARLLEKYSSAEDRLEFRFQIGSKGPIDRRTIAAADQFHYRPDCLMPFNIGGPVVSVNASAGSAHSFASKAGRYTAEFGGGPSVPLKSLLHAAGHCQIPPSLSNSGLMQLSVRRPQRTLSEVYRGFRRRNEILSGAVIVILLAALAALVISTEQARTLARLQTLVAAGISHELRTPLASLSVAADDLKSGHVENVEQARRYGEIIDAQSRRLRRIVDQALALTTPAQSDGSPCFRRVSVPEILSAAVNGLAPLLSETKIEVERCIAPDVPGILADPELVLRCLTNLIENAVKYAASGRRILLSAQGCRYYGRSVVEVTIEDRGPGIERDEVAAVFEPFYRGRSARSSREPGSGLGLAIAKHAMDAQGGWIKLERVVPKGCRFRLFFLPEDPAIVHFVDSKAAG